MGGLTKAPSIKNLLRPVPNSIKNLTTVTDEASELVASEIIETSNEMITNHDLNKLAEKALKGFIMDAAQFTGPGITAIEFKDSCESSDSEDTGGNAT